MMTQQKLKINQEYLKKVPRPEPEQYQALKESIQKEGQLEPIIVNEKYEIIDGYTRYQILNELKQEPTFQVKHFKDKNLESRYVRTVNLKRRHLNALQTYELFEADIEEIKQQNIRIANQTNWDKRKGKIPRNTTRMKYENSTQYKTMQLTGLSAGTIEGIVYLKNNADEKTIEDVKNGKIGLFAIVNKMKDKETRKIPVKEKYRSKFQVTIDVLNTISLNKDCLISHISRKANLSHYSVISYVEPLTKANFLIEKRTNRNLYYNLTTTGIDFLKRCQELFNSLPERLRI